MSQTVVRKNKYLDDASVSSDSDDGTSEDIDIHEIVRGGNYIEVKEAIAKDRPRLVCLKDKVRMVVAIVQYVIFRLSNMIFVI